ncbi:MAG: hypothetical protein K2K57_09310 [Oscillospiraceae bacterium]|nr:hypothetical protein [Oscillospiraceae bacterium]
MGIHILALISGALGIYFIICNGIIFWRVWIKKIHSPSVMPFLGGLLAGAAVLLLTTGEYSLLCIIPMLLDWGCISAVIRCLYCLIKKT